MLFDTVNTKRLAVRLVLALLLLVVAAGASASPAAAANEDHIFIEEIVPYDEMLYNECGAGGAGEYLHVTGYLHVVYFEIANDAGGAVYNSMVNPLDMTGVGMDTGTLYRGTGMSQGISTVKADGESGTYTSINNYMLIGQGAGGNLVVHGTFHITYNANGLAVMVSNDVDGCY